MTVSEQIPWYYRLTRKLATQKPVAWLAGRTMHHLDPLMYRLSDGRWTAAGLLIGLPMVHLTSRGAKSGRPRTVPLLAIPHGEAIILVASNWGDHRNPGWYYNLRQNPRATVSQSGQTRAYVAREAAGAEREALWQKAVAIYGGYDAYRERTGGRDIPIMVLTPLSAAGAP